MARSPFHSRDHMYETELALHRIRLHLIEMLESDECYQCLQISCCCYDYAEEDEEYSLEEDLYYDYFYEDYTAPPRPEDLPQPHFHADNHWTLIETQDLICSWAVIKRKEQDDAWAKAKADLGLFTYKDYTAPPKDQPAYVDKVEKWFAQGQTQVKKVKKTIREECFLEVIQPDWPPTNDSPWCYTGHQVLHPSSLINHCKYVDVGQQQPNHSGSKTLYSAVADFFQQFVPRRDGFYNGVK